MENIQSALLLLLIGVIIVFLVLSLVVGLGNLLIRVTNRYVSDNNGNGTSEIGKAGNDPKKIAAIVAAVDIATQGRGRIDSIKKTDKI